MVTKTFFTTLIVLFCGFAPVDNCNYEPKTQRETKKEQRQVEIFNQISLSIAGDIFLSQGSSQELTVEAPADELELIETVVENGNLIIKCKRPHCNIKGPVKLYITTTAIKAISVGGSGDVKTVTPIDAPELKLSVAGSGDINVDNLTSKDVTIDIAGSGDVILKGTQKCNSLSASIAGSGDINTKDLMALNAKVDIAGSGDVTVYAEELLDASIVGSGDVIVYGRPKINGDVTGSGDIRSGK